ncbi:SPOSA6832_01069 [Sporobolomyces salmonicolor]|uniref:SPOSA6832_01069-mRNA-1:cds n=1 Tax=Sporidiobolus salmonicolor TaxID=5005 RepID=A0A0D6EHY7_SPOSA|nr:SPOSA6832_01069 [Sporobolomyces salmonicolor]
MKTWLVLVALGLTRAPAFAALDPRLVLHNRRHHAVPQSAHLTQRGGNYGGSGAYTGVGGAYGAAAQGGGAYTSGEPSWPSYSLIGAGAYGGGSNGYGGGWSGGMGAGSPYETCMQTCYAEQGLTWEGSNTNGDGGGWETTIYKDSSGAWATATYQGGAYETGTSQSSSAGGGMGYGSAGSGSPPSSAMSDMIGNGSMLGGASMVGGDLIAGPNQVVVAPKLGDLRMVPFNIAADTGMNLTFVWGAGPHTVTQSSALTICNASKESGAFKSGKQQKGFQFPVQVTSQATVFYYCGVPTHCEKGMFGLINGQVANDANGTFESAMATMAANDSTFGQLMQQTQAMCKNVPEAASWGANLATSQIPEWALPMAMENTLYTRQYFAMNPSLLAAANLTSSPTSSATSTSLVPTSAPHVSMNNSTGPPIAAGTGDSQIAGAPRPALSVEFFALASLAFAVLL